MNIKFWSFLRIWQLFQYQPAISLLKVVHKRLQQPFYTDEVIHCMRVASKCMPLFMNIQWLDFSFNVIWSFSSRHVTNQHMTSLPAVSIFIIWYTPSVTVISVTHQTGSLLYKLWKQNMFNLCPFLKITSLFQSTRPIDKSVSLSQHLKFLIFWQKTLNLFNIPLCRVLISVN